jgi:hypothetical protein
MWDWRLGQSLAARVNARLPLKQTKERGSVRARAAHGRVPMVQEVGEQTGDLLTYLLTCPLANP